MRNNHGAVYALYPNVVTIDDTDNAMAAIRRVMDELPPA